MARLPNGDKALVPQAKITRYLLDLTSKQGRTKAQFFLEGELQTPDQRNPQIRSVWKIERGETIPLLVTAYPLGERKDDAPL